MSRVIKDNRPGLKPVTKIELSEKHTTLRFVIVIVCIAIAAAAFAYGVYSWINVEPGWTQIEVSSGSGLSCADEFVFLYELGAGDISSITEQKALTLIYTETMGNAYEIFNNDQSFEGVHNVYELNQHPNEVMVVEDVLYKAFELIQSYENRSIYLAPVYARYDDMFVCNDDVETYDYDPYQNSEVAAEYEEIAAYAADASQVDVHLLGDGQVELFVSEEYLEYAKENGITSFIDFFWMKNAFIVDYLAQTIASNGYTNGTLSSYDGFSRNLDNRDVSYSLNIYDRMDETIYGAAVMQYEGELAIVSLRDYKLTQQDCWHYYEFANGDTRSSYLDIRDGKCRSALPNLVSYSEQQGCAQILMEISNLYISDEFDEEGLLMLGADGIYSVYCIDNRIYYNEPMLKLLNLYDIDGIRYSSVFRTASET